MHRVYLEKSKWKGSELLLPEEEARHLSVVLRAEVGDEVFVFDGAGHTARAQVSSLDPVTLALLSDNVFEKDPSVGVTILQAVPKGKRMDLIVEKATELGAARIIPVRSERVVVDPGEGKVERWRRITVSAAKQCGLNSIPVIDDVTSFPDALASCSGIDLLLTGSLEVDAKPLKDVLRASEAKSVCIIVGPEGDLTEAEYAAARNAGAVPCNLGDLVLRVETAALYMISAINYELA